MCFSFVCFVFLNNCPAILDNGLKYELICGFCFIADVEIISPVVFWVRVATWSLFARKWRPHLHEGLRGRHLQGRHGDLHVANGDLEHQVWSPFGRHSDLTFASGDHMQSPKLLLVATWSPWRPRVTSGDIGRFFIRLLLKHNAAHTQSSLFSNSLNSKAVART